MFKYLAILLLSALSYGQEVHGPVPEPYLALRRAAVQVATESGWGSGAVVKAASGTQYVLTNWHVCNGSIRPKHATYIFSDGEKATGRILKMDPTVDLCLIWVEDQQRPAIIISKRAPIPGTHLVTRGYPHLELRESEGRYVEERDSVLNMAEVLNGDPCPKGNLAKYNMLHELVLCLMHYPFGLTTLYSAPGSSGSAVLNDDSELVAVIQSSAADVNAAGVIPLRHIEAFFKGK